ncbi:cytochrome P450 [Hyaloraphidium curvatum]|nr:cytochrome P450 [Hyaloraphidium curvatum]
MADASVLLGWAVMAAATLYLLRQLFNKFFLDFDDDFKTVLSMPFVDRPPADRVTQMHLVDAELIRKHGPRVRYVNMLKPWESTLVIADPALLREIFVGVDWQKWQRGTYGTPAEAHAAYTAGLISTPNGQLWRDTRALFERTFTTVAVRKYTPILLEIRSVLVDQLAKANKENPDGFDIFPYYHRFTFDTITRLVFGSEIRAQTEARGADYAKNFDLWLDSGALLQICHQLLGKWSWSLLGSVVRQQKKSNDMMFGLIEEQVQRLKRGEKRNCIFDDVYGKEDISALIDDDHLRKALMSVLFAGHDTTAALLSFMTYELSKRPELQAAIRAEVEEVNGPGELENLEVLEKCKVLNACIKESLRMRPSAPYGAARYVTDGFELRYQDLEGKPAKVIVGSHQMVFPALHAMQNYQPYWDKDVNKFLPERYYDDPNGGSKAGLFSNAPFGNGARRCVGERLALGEGRLAIASVLRKYDIVAVPEGPDTWQFQEVFAGTIKPNKVMIKLKPIAA